MSFFSSFIGNMSLVRLILFFAVMIMAGCANNPSLSGLYAGKGGALANFDVARFDDGSAAKVSPALEKPMVNAGIGNYSFSVDEVQFREVSLLADGSHAPSVKIVARNNGYAPVSVTVTHDRDLTYNMSPDVIMPYSTVVPPRSEKTVVRFEPRNNRARWKLTWAYTWKIGDYTAQHTCPERYRFPFPDGVPASASIAENQRTHRYAANIVVFSLPAWTKVLAARKGTVVRIGENSELDILHDDSTVATYSHLGAISGGIMVGKAVQAGEELGLAGKTGDMSYVHLAVWRPEPNHSTTLVKGEKLDFETVTFPMEFCTASKNCRIIRQSEQADPAATAHASTGRLVAGSAVGEYDFKVVNGDKAESKIFPDIRTSSMIVAQNRGHAPVSVTINFDERLPENIRTDITMPYTSVVPPTTELVLARLYPVDERKPNRFGWVSSWSLGDLSAAHNCPEKYRYPFAVNTRALASVPDKTETDPYIKNTLVFTIPLRTAVLAIRKGIVIRIRNNNDLDILHEDSTIATYNNLESLDKDLIVGKSVQAGDQLAIAGRSEKTSRSHVQITVWKPEKASKGLLIKGAKPGFNSVSIPLEFCTSTQDCKVLTQNQPIEWKASRKVKKANKRQ